MKGIYLGAYTAYHPGHNLIYQDINGLRDLSGDMICVDLSEYDYIISTPPCNWWSRANYRRESSLYSLKTKYLLPCILHKLLLLDKPFIVENVRNKKLFIQYGLYNLPGCYVKHVGRHTYWSNIDFPVDDIIQKPIVFMRDGKRIYMSSQNLARKDRQGGTEVHDVIERFINFIGG